MKRLTIHTSLATGRIPRSSLMLEFMQDDSPLVWVSYLHLKTGVSLLNPLPPVATTCPRCLILAGPELHAIPSLPMLGSEGPVQVQGRRCSQGA